MEQNESEWAAPAYSIIEKRAIGQKVITAVILDGELVEFERNVTDKDVSSN